MLNAVKDKSVDDMENGHIKSGIQNLILRFGDVNRETRQTEGEVIAAKASKLYNDESVTQSDIWVPLIWRALNFKGYDVHPEWFKTPDKFDNNETRKFNTLVKELANIPGWSEYAIHILTTENGKDLKNDFFDKTIVDKSNVYYKSYLGQDLDKYRMAMYLKYIKYKNKYIQLKNSL